MPQNRGARARKAQAEQAKEPEPPDEGEVIPAREVAAATTDEVLGKKNGDKAADGKESSANQKDGDKTAEAKPEPQINITGLPGARPKPAPKKPKPITVASTPIIGNYQLPSLDFLQLPDTTVKPTESKEELMANARLMQQTLAQFDIEVALGDITKGPDDHALRIASRARREAGKNHRAQQ